MEETISEFLQQEKISTEVNMSMWSEKQKKWVYIKPQDFIDKYNKFLRKKSYLK